MLDRFIVSTTHSPQTDGVRGVVLGKSTIGRRVSATCWTGSLRPEVVTEGHSLIFTGEPGRGKNHLAVAIAYRAPQSGVDAYSPAAAARIDDLSGAFRAARLADAHPAQPAVLVLD